MTALMADRKSLNFICCVICILISATNLRIDAEEFSPRHGTCESDESEDNFCHTEDENMYLGNSNFDINDHGTNLQNNEDEKISTDDLPEEKLSTEDAASVSEISDKQIHLVNNFTSEWLGLQIPIVDGVRVSVQFLHILDLI